MAAVAGLLVEMSAILRRSFGSGRVAVVVDHFPFLKNKKKMLGLVSTRRQLG